MSVPTLRSRGRPDDGVWAPSERTDDSRFRRQSVEGSHKDTDGRPRTIEKDELPSFRLDQIKIEISIGNFLIPR